MGNSGVGILLGGDASATMPWILLLGAAVLGLILLYGMQKTGQVTRRGKEQLEKNTEVAQRRDDPQKR